MNKTFVTDKLTPLTADEAIAATSAAFARVLGRMPSAETLAILVSHTALECGQWKSLHCWNLGNVKGADPRTGLYTQYRCDERLPEAQARRDIATATQRPDGSPSAVLKAKNPDGTWAVDFFPPHPQCTFRAYRTAEDAFEDYLTFLAVDTTPNNGRPNRYAKAWAAAVAGDLRAFVYELKAAGYFTARTDVYYDGGDGPGGKPGILALYEQFLPRCRAHLGVSDRESEPPPTDPHPQPQPVDIEAERRWLATQSAKRAHMTERELLLGLHDRFDRLTLVVQHWANETMRLTRTETEVRTEISGLGDRMGRVERKQSEPGMAAVGSNGNGAPQQ